MQKQHIKFLREAFSLIESKIEGSKLNDSDMYHTINNARIAIDEIEEKQHGLLTNVLPEESVLFKINHDMFVFYKCYEDFESEKEYTSQESKESFDNFIVRTIEKLQIDEAESDEQYPTVTIDYAIYSNGV